jgi:hypothetical protein
MLLHLALFVRPKEKKRNTKTPSLGVKIIFLKVPFVIAAALQSLTGKYRGLQGNPCDETGTLQ